MLPCSSQAHFCVPNPQAPRAKGNSQPPRAPHIIPTSITNLPLLSSAGQTLTVSSTWASQPLLFSGINTSMPITPQAESGFSLASSFAPIPNKLVKKIQALEFVEMQELLPDNIALAERLEALPLHATHSSSPETREVGALFTWVSAFYTYVAVVAAAHPDRVRDMLAYMRLLTREAQKYGGSGWLIYDQVFRRNRMGPSARWDELDPSLHIAYITSQADKPVAPCANCNEADHPSCDCALASLVPPTKRPALAPSSGEANRQRVTKRSSRPYPQRRISLSWNRGKCIYEGACSYAHTCATCSDPHPACDCPATPAESGPGQLHLQNLASARPGLMLWDQVVTRITAKCNVWCSLLTSVLLTHSFSLDLIIIITAHIPRTIQLDYSTPGTRLQ